MCACSMAHMLINLRAHVRMNVRECIDGLAESLMIESHVFKEADGAWRHTRAKGSRPLWRVRVWMCVWPGGGVWLLLSVELGKQFRCWPEFLKC